MIDFDTAFAASAKDKGPRCQLCRLLDSLDDVQRAKVQTALESPMEQTRLARTLGLMTGDKVWDSRGAMVGTHRTKHMS
jgi:hypothetical protein